MKFLVWFEPERVSRGTYLAKEHPEWVISPAGDGSGLFNLGTPAAREFMTKYLVEVIKQYKMDWLRIDYNIDPLGFWQFLDKKDPDRVGMAEIRYIEGLYRMWDDLRAAYPQLAIDDCASGGRRIDLETMSRSTPLWRSDNTCDMLDHKPQTVVLAAMKNQIDDRRTEPLRAVEHVWPDGIVAVSVPQRHERRDQFRRRLPPARLSARATQAGDCRSQATAAVFLWRFLRAWVR